MRACDGPLYNHYDEGGYLIWFAPEKPVFVDNREDPFPLQHIIDELEVHAAGALPPAVRPMGNPLRVPFGQSPTLPALDRDGLDHTLSR